MSTHREQISTLKKGDGFERELLAHIKHQPRPHSYAFTQLLDFPPLHDLMDKKNTISTSRLDGPQVCFFTFRAELETGLGIAYVVDTNEKLVRFLISHHKKMEEKANTYIETLKKAWDAQMELLKLASPSA